MAIESIAFGANLRPSTVSLIKKMNEVINFVNRLDPAEIETLQTQIQTLTTKTDATDTRVSTIANRVSDVETANTSQQTDIDAIKVTLYTPLTDSE